MDKVDKGRALIVVAIALALAPVPALRVLGGRGIDKVLDVDRAQRESAALAAFGERLREAMKKRLEAPFDLRLHDEPSVRIDDSRPGSPFSDPIFLAARARVSEPSASGDDLFADLFNELDAAGAALRNANDADSTLYANLLAARACERAKRSDLAMAFMARIRKGDEAASEWTPPAARRRVIALSPEADRAKLVAAWIDEIAMRATDLDEIAWVGDAIAAEAPSLRKRLSAVTHRERVAREIEVALSNAPQGTIALVMTEAVEAYVVTADHANAKAVDYFDLIHEAGGWILGHETPGEVVSLNKSLVAAGLFVRIGPYFEDRTAVPLEPSVVFGSLGETGVHRALDVALAVYAALALALGFALLRGHSRAAALARTQADLIAQITHELRTPLTVLRMYGESLAQDRVPAESRQHYVTTMSEEAARLGGLVDRVARAARGDEPNEDAAASCDAIAVLRPLVAVHERAIAATGGALDSRFAASATVRCDPEDLRLVIDVLLDNAAQYGKTEGGGARVELGVERSADRLAIAVRDHGPGIAVEDRPRLFERFARGATGRRSQHRGAGMGLFLARRIARSAGGDLVLEFPEDGGTLARLTLPIANLENES